MKWRRHQKAGPTPEQPITLRDVFTDASVERRFSLHAPDVERHQAHSWPNVTLRSDHEAFAVSRNREPNWPCGLVKYPYIQVYFLFEERSTLSLGLFESAFADIAQLDVLRAKVYLINGVANTSGQELALDGNVVVECASGGLRGATHDVRASKKLQRVTFSRGMIILGS
jgi:hypothetical protein